MAKRTLKPKEAARPDIRDQILDDITQLWNEHGGRYLNALDDNPNKKLMVSFPVTLSLGDDANPDIVTQMKFKDKTRESGMDVVKNFTAKRTNTEQDPNAQPELINSEANEN